ncbi:MAG: Inner membrane transport permease YbhR [bacterium ADurb.Bin374]|nr:MAG: Inner membrane transport permease YbhR [bacterium ADurb.Bin374]
MSDASTARNTSGQASESGVNGFFRRAERIRRLVIKEFIQIFRDNRMKGVILVLPFIQLFVFSYAMATDVRHVPTAVCDRDGTLQSRELTARFFGSGVFADVGAPRTDSELREILDLGKALVVLRFEPGFGAGIAAGRTMPLQILADGTDSNTAGIALQYANRIIRAFNDDLRRERLRRTAGTLPRAGDVAVESRSWYNPNREAVFYFVPGVVALIVSLVSLMLTGMAIVREKEIGTIEQIMVSPITPFEFIIGKTLPFALICIGEIVLVMSVAVFWFGIPVRGSIVLLFVAAGLYMLTTLGIGLLISTLCETQQQAMMSTFLFFTPAMLLSGFAFPIANMPDVIQALTLINPMRYFLVIIRSIFLKGTGIAVLWPQFTALALIGFTTFFLSSRRFRKTIS